jgi:hypothetical protein
MVNYAIRGSTANVKKLLMYSRLSVEVANVRKNQHQRKLNLCILLL